MQPNFQDYFEIQIQSRFFGTPPCSNTSKFEFNRLRCCMIWHWSCNSSPMLLTNFNAIIELHKRGVEVRQQLARHSFGVFYGQIYRRNQASTNRPKTEVNLPSGRSNGESVLVLISKPAWVSTIYETYETRALCLFQFHMTHYETTRVSVHHYTGHLWTRNSWLKIMQCLAWVLKFPLSKQIDRCIWLAECVQIGRALGLRGHAKVSVRCYWPVLKYGMQRLQ